MRLCTIVAVALLPLAAAADQWSFPPELKNDPFTFGNTTIHRIRDAREDQTYPEYRIDIFTDGELVGRFGGHSFEHIAASDEGRVFIAISNSGLPGTAILLFDADGNIRALVDHRIHGERFAYCSRSVTIEREWYDKDDPALEFKRSEDSASIQVRSCDGGVINLLEMLP